MPGTRVLVVDDEPMNLEIIGEYLADSDYSLIMIGSAEAAWALLDDGEAPADLILLDRMMPGMDGIELLRRIKSDPRLANLPVVMQTAAATPNQVREGLQSGAYYYLTKPFEPEALQTIIRAALEERERRNELARRVAERQHFVALIESADFSLRTLDEAQALAAALGQLCPAPDRAAVGLAELMVNAIEHGNLGITYFDKLRLRQTDQWREEVMRRLALPENASKRVRVRFERREGALSFVVGDEGPGFDWRQYMEFSPDRAFDPNGRGIAIARSIAFSSIRFNDSGNEVEASIAVELGD